MQAPLTAAAKFAVGNGLVGYLYSFRGALGMSSRIDTALQRPGSSAR